MAGPPTPPPAASSSSQPVPWARRSSSSSRASGRERSSRRTASPSCHELGGVGENLQDHLQIRMAYKVKHTRTLNEQANSLIGRAWMGIEYLLFRRGPLAMAPSQLGGFAKSDASRETPNLEYHIQPLSLDRFDEPPHPFPAFTASVCNLRPESRGFVRIKSADARAHPAIQPNYLASATDRQVAATAMRLTRRICAAPALARFEPEEFRPGSQYESDEELAREAGNIGTTIFHPVGTCKMGRDPLAVVDERLRVHGIARPARGRRLDHADHHLGQHQLARHHDRGKGRGHDPRGRRTDVSGSAQLLCPECGDSLRWVPASAGRGDARNAGRGSGGCCRRAPAPLQLVLAVGDVEPARDDDGRPDPGREVGELGEEEVAQEGGPDELAVAHGRAKRGRAPLHRLDDEIMSDEPEDPHAGEDEPVEERRRQDEGREGQDDGRDGEAAQAGKRDRDRGGVRAADLARENLVDRIAERVEQHEHGTPLHHVRAGPDDEEGSREAHDHRRPTPRADLLAQHGHRECRHDDGAREGNRTRGRQRHGQEAEEVEGRGAEEEDRAHELSAGMLGREDREAPARQEDDQAEEDVSGIARPENLGHRVDAAEVLHGGAEEGERRHGQHHVEHGAQHRFAAERARRARSEDWLGHEVRDMGRDARCREARRRQTVIRPLTASMAKSSRRFRPC